MSDRICGRMIIYLGWLSPATSSDQPKAGGPRTLCFGLASDGVYMCPPCCQGGGSLLHCPSTLTASGNARSCGTFLLHFPWSRLHRTLSGILPCEARTFLTPDGNPAGPRSFVLLIVYGYAIVLLHMETRSANKLPDDRVLCDTVTWQRQEIIKELEQSLRLQILRARLVNGKQQWLRVDF